MKHIFLRISFVVIFLQSSFSEKANVHDDDWFKDLEKVGFQFNDGSKQWEKEDTYYKTCGAALDTDVWMITNSVNLSRVSAKLLYVDMKVEFDLCDDINGNGELEQCKNDTLQVYVEFDPTAGYTEIINTAELERRFSPVIATISNNTNGTQNETFSFAHNPTRKEMVFALRALGACVKLYDMTVYYYYCEERVVKNVEIPRTISPAHGYQVNTIQLNTSCVNNSVPPPDEKRSLYAYCYSNGTSLVNYGNSTNETVECRCREGYEPNDGCQQCEKNFYKNTSSNSNCSKCPENTASISNHTNCTCNEGFYNFEPLPTKCYALLVMPGNAKVQFVKPDQMNITWSVPTSNGLTEDLTFYDVECFKCDNATSCIQPCSTAGRYNLTTTSYLFPNVDMDEQYLFKIFAKNSVNNLVDKSKWNYTIVVYNQTTVTSETSDDEDHKIYYIAAGAVALMLLILIICVMILILKRSKRGKLSTQNRDGFSNLELSNRQRTYVAPSTYATPDEALLDFASELDPTELNLERIIGGGEFGDVYKGILSKPNEDCTIPVAVKTLKVNASEKSHKDFILEASMMAQFDHINVVKLEGVVTKSSPRMIVLEFVPNGSLDNYLKSNEGNLTSLQLVGMCAGVAKGMEYLAGIQFVHRDLAARNVLVSENLLCKIADFGLSRELENTDTSRGEYVTSGGKIPVRWTAPEAFRIHTFSSASDVWSYGILLWEIFSYAERPYGDWDNFKILDEIADGYRLPAPKDCPKAAHDLMLSCWQEKRLNRPSFSEITTLIDKWIRSPETLDDTVNFTESWLKSIHMEQYLSHFNEMGYKTPSQIFALTDQALKETGVRLIGHRNKMLKSIIYIHQQRLGDDTAISVFEM